MLGQRGIPAIPMPRVLHGGWKAPVHSPLLWGLPGKGAQRAVLACTGAANWQHWVNLLIVNLLKCSEVCEVH